MENVREDLCPICGNDNKCGAHEDGPCWCNDEDVPKEMRNLISIEKQMKACVCQDCIKKFKVNAKNSTA